MTRSGRKSARFTGARERQPSPDKRSGASKKPLLLRLSALAAVALVVLAGVALWARWSRAPGIVRKPDQNVLLVTIDTLRADALGYAGGQATTPNLDRLAAEGTRFDFAHAHAVFTLPSHASILTGTYPFTHGIRDNSGYRLDPRTPTLAALLRRAGYATGAFVGAFPLDSRFGLDASFSEYDDKYGETNRLGALVMPERPADVVVGAAMNWIKQQGGKWFAWVHVYDPHSPYRPPPPFDLEYRDNPYAGEVAYTDHALGPLLDLARATSRPTLVVVTSDHGEALGSHGEQTHGLFAYEATLRIPLILAVTEGHAASRTHVSQTPARHVDILPTILESLDMAIPPELPGQSLLPAVDGVESTDRSSYFEAMSASLNRGWAPLTGVLMGREKFIQLPIPELYDLSADPEERKNLLPARNDRRSSLEERLRTFEAGTTGSARRPVESAELRERLRSLGYLAGAAPARTEYGVEDDPKQLVPIDTAIHHAVELFQAGRPLEALTRFEGLIRERPSMPLGYLQAAFLQWELGQPRQAIETLKSALRAGAMTSELEAQLGIYLAEAGSPEEAIRLLEPQRSMSSPDVDALNGLGIALARAGRRDEAIAVFRRALEVDRTNASALQNIGTVHLESGNLSAAGEALEAALALDPSLAKAHTGMGVVALRMGDRAKAITSWRRAVELDPTEYDALFNLATELVNDGQFSAARPYLERFVKDAPPAFYGPDIQKITRLLQRIRWRPSHARR